MLGTQEEPYDIIISGAGPGGLTAGIISGRHQQKTLICEKEATAAPFPRGETLHSAKIFTKILGANVLNMISTHMTAARKFYSPNAEQSREIYRHSPSIIYDWQHFIDLLLTRAKEANVEFRYNAEVVSPILDQKTCVGIQLASGEKIYGKTVLVCDGHASKIGRSLGISYDEINCPTMKRVVSNYTDTYLGFQYFILPQGMLEYAPRFPPAVVFVFPRGNNQCEVGLIVFSEVAQRLKSHCDVPDQAEMTRVWNKLIDSYPVFSTLMKETKKNFEGFTQIAMGNVHPHPMPYMGLILTGGAIGFVEASGGSGIASSMQQTDFSAEFITKHHITEWTMPLANLFIRSLKRKKFWKHILSNSKRTRFGKKYIFVKLRTATNINRKWSLLQHFF